MKGLLRTSALMNKECRAIGAAASVSSMPPQGDRVQENGQGPTGGAETTGGSAGMLSARATAQCAKWYVADYEWFAEEARAVLAGIAGMAAATELEADDVVLQLTSYRDVSWVRQ